MLQFSLDFLKFQILSSFMFQPVQFWCYFFIYELSNWKIESWITEKNLKQNIVIYKALQPL